MVNWTCSISFGVIQHETIHTNLTERKFILSPYHTKIHKNNINFILVWQFYLRFHPQISTFQTKQDWCPPFSSMIFPATETSMASSGILQPAMELTPEGGTDIIACSLNDLQFPIDVSHWCSPLMFPQIFPSPNSQKTPEGSARAPPKSFAGRARCTSPR